MSVPSLLRRAQWIWPLDSRGYYTFHKLINVYADFRYDFRLAKVPTQAPFYITADQAYQLYINGRYVGRGPARGYQVSWPFDEYAIAPFLRRGHNWISVRAYNAGTSTFQYLHQSRAGMLCAGRVGRLNILSGPQWQARISPAYRRRSERLSLQLNFQEWVDARRGDQAWIWEERKPVGWPRWLAGLPYGSMPWHALEPRALPNLSKELFPYARVFSRARGPAAAQAALAEDLNQLFLKEQGRLRWTRVAEDARALRLPATGAGQLRAVTLDFGRPTCGTLLAEVAHAAGGESVDFYFGEVAHANGRVVLNLPQRACYANMYIRLTLKPGQNRYESFQMIGHRYLTIIVRNTHRALAFKLQCRQTIYPFEIKGSFYCDDQVLNDIYRICQRTQEVCSLDSYVDTPWREQAQWWGDARVQAQNTFHMSADPRLLVRGIRSLARQSLPNGLTYGHAPTMAHNCILPDFSLIWALTIWDYYYQTGDLSLFQEQWPRIQKLLGYFSDEGCGSHGLLQADARYWIFLDWCDIHRNGAPTLYNLWYLLALEKLSLLARSAKMVQAQRQLKALYAKQRRLVLDKLWDKDAHLFHDGLQPNGRPVKVYSIHCQTLAILCGLQTAWQRHMLTSRLLPYLRGEPIAGPLPSSYWVTYVYEVMKRRGFGAEVARHIRSKWAPMIRYGGTWETFNPKIGNHSVSHAWAAHPLAHLTGILGGVMQAGVAWQSIRFAPVFLDGIKQAQVVVPTPAGLIKASWQRAGTMLSVRLDLPAKVQAAVSLPGIGPHQVLGAKHIWNLPLKQ